ncbi:hypothetical protein TWF481_001266 [Arthrobotrys musiformis]|uniref:Uncharacterized protein n=1 Tax=Arthrobotrys musiformis TaxID=47236 RepID=A0AAV9WQA4_9PEZI
MMDEAWTPPRDSGPRIDLDTSAKGKKMPKWHLLKLFPSLEIVNSALAPAAVATLAACIVQMGTSLSRKDQGTFLSFLAWFLSTKCTQPKCRSENSLFLLADWGEDRLVCKCIADVLAIT